ncbi:UpxY family transcription antiterminator [Rufibacter radiotolerans]|nr:UpxY family transcription antiterminator [Rufibacter radiotolerans]
MHEKWYAVYTKPRWEKKVAASFTERLITNYCPLNRVTRQWSDRKKTVLEPLFTSYVFVRVPEKQLYDLKKTNGVLSLVNWLGKPAVIREEEIDTIREFLTCHSNVFVAGTEISLYNTVRVNEGSLTDKEGTVIAIKNKTLKVALPSLGFTMYAEVPKASVEVLQYAAADF